jgi:hypothetical protein
MKRCPVPRKSLSLRCLPKWVFKASSSSSTLKLYMERKRKGEMGDGRERGREKNASII